MNEISNWNVWPKWFVVVTDWRATHQLWTNDMPCSFEKKKLRYIEFAWWTMNCVLKQRFSCCIDQVVICQFTALYGLVHIRLNCFLSWLIDVLLVNYELTICPFFWKTLLHWICLVNYELCFEQEISLLDLLLSSLYLLSFVLSIVWV